MSRQEKMLAKKRGRPATGRGKTIGVRCHEDLLESIDEWRRGERDLPTRAEAIRRLVQEAFDSHKKRRP
jgi:metal-responsive CopG/Arc/MetJ family transcriptional regulator